MRLGRNKVACPAVGAERFHGEIDAFADTVYLTRAPKTLQDSGRIAWPRLA